MGGSHILSTDASSSSSLIKELKKSKKRKPKRVGQAILEEDEKFEDEPTISVQTNLPDRSRKLAERDAYLKRPPNQTVTLIKSQFSN